MAILGGAILTAIQGQVSELIGSINLAYFVPLVCFIVIAYYGAVACRKDLATSTSQ
jgi:FHS family L-fucose permease-like MFS transporter